jgi:hypothetical protein
VKMLVVGGIDYGLVVFYIPGIYIYIYTVCFLIPMIVLAQGTYEEPHWLGSKSCRVHGNLGYYAKNLCTYDKKIFLLQPEQEFQVLYHFGVAKMLIHKFFCFQPSKCMPKLMSLLVITQLGIIEIVLIRCLTLVDGLYSKLSYSGPDAASTRPPHQTMLIIFHLPRFFCLERDARCNTNSHFYLS